MEDKILLDKKGVAFVVGLEVLAPDPISSDSYSHSFVGTVADILIESDTVVVEDGLDFFEIEHYRLEIL